MIYRVYINMARCMWYVRRTHSERNAATQYCPSCELDLCDDCSTSLHSNKGLSKHQVVERAKRASVMGPPLCEVHRGRPKDLYCIECKVRGELDRSVSFISTQFERRFGSPSGGDV